jgi:hypothetical protein
MPLDIRIRFGRAILLITGNSLLLKTTLRLTQKGSTLGIARDSAGP